jgi:5-formyltetrahydrofolate cyclo-ligase
VSSQTDRQALRRELRDRRRALPAASRIAGAEELAGHLLSLPGLPDAGYVAGYWATDGEIGLHAWQLRLPPGLVYCLPVLGADHRLRFAPWRPGDPLTSNRYGIPEPDIAPAALLDADALSLVAMPLVGFDLGCHRLGMGGGWYDRSFAFRQSRVAPPMLIGVGFDEQETDPLALAPWDVIPDAICTPTRTLHRP